jgi:hypothetical protein
MEEDGGVLRWLCQEGISGSYGTRVAVSCMLSGAQA